MFVRAVIVLQLLVNGAIGTAATSEPRMLGERLMPLHVPQQILAGANRDTFNPLHHLSAISPYFDSPGMNPTPPPGCKVTKAAYFVRHSNIYASDFDYQNFIAPFTSKLARFTNRRGFATVARLAFLANWTTPLTDPAKQVGHQAPSGAESAAAFGAMIAHRYPSLAPWNATDAAFSVWASLSERSVDSARDFIRGAFPHGGARLVTVPQTGPGASSLPPQDSCTTYDGGAGSAQTDTFTHIYTAPIVQRFNTAFSEFNFTAYDIVAMQQLCGYETIIRNSSDFCGAFEELDWLGFEYSNDLPYFYKSGYGSPISPQMGMPWVAASAALLASSNTSQDLYISIAHRGGPPVLVTALGLFNNSESEAWLDVNETMSSSKINFDRQWRTSHIMSFLGHVALERLECFALQSTPSREFNDNGAISGAGRGGSAVFVRALVNGAIIPFPTCQDGPGASCALGDFTTYLEERVREYGDYKRGCGINDTNATNELTIYH